MAARATMSVQLAGVALLVGGTTWAAERPANWQCAKCPFPEGAKLQTTAGGGYQSDDSFKFGDYTGLDEDGAFLIADFTADYFGDKAWRWSAEGKDLGLDSRRFSLEGGRQGLLQVRFGYEELPRHLFETASTIYPTPGSSNLQLPAGWVRAPSTAGMTELSSSLRGMDVEWDRESWNTGFTFVQSKRFSYDVDYRHLERDGKQLRGGSFLTLAATLPSPVDDETDTLEAGLNYEADNWSARVAYYGSFYNNDNDTLTWQNAFTAITPGADAGQIALAPDNEFQQISLSGHYYGWERTRVSGRLAVGRMEQDEGVLPYTLNPNLAGGALPRSSFDGEVDTLHADLRVSSRPWKNLRLRGEFVYDERDNDTPRDTWNYVVTDTFAAGTPRDNLPYGYERYRVALSGSYRFPFGTNGQLGYEYDNNDRDYTQIEETEQHEVWTELRISPLDVADLRLKYSWATRDGDDYNPVPATQPPQNALLRKYSQADRDRESLELSLSVQPFEQLDFTLTALVAEDEYDDTILGLEEAEYRNFTVDTGLRLPGDAMLTGQLGYDKFETTQFGSQSFSFADWQADQEDESWISGLSLDLPRLIERLQARISYTYIDTTGEIDNNTNGLESSFPDLETDRHRVEVDLTYALRDNIDIGFAYLYEDYDVDDWTLDGVAPDTVGTLLATGARWQGYDVNLITLSFTWSLDR